MSAFPSLPLSVWLSHHACLSLTEQILHVSSPFLLQWLHLHFLSPQIFLPSVSPIFLSVSHTFYSFPAFHLLLFNTLSCFASPSIPFLFPVLPFSVPSPLPAGYGLLLDLWERPNDAEMQQCSAGAPWWAMRTKGSAHTRNARTHNCIKTQTQAHIQTCTLRHRCKGAIANVFPPVCTHVSGTSSNKDVASMP